MVTNNDTPSFMDQLREAPGMAGVADAAADFPERELFEESEYRAFVMVRGSVRQAEVMMISFKSGMHDGFEYSHRYRAECDGEKRIRLTFSEHIVTIHGMRLWDGFCRLAIRQVLRIQEADGPTVSLLADSKEPVITRIEVSERGDEE